MVRGAVPVLVLAALVFLLAAGDQPDGLDQNTSDVDWGNCLACHVETTMDLPSLEMIRPLGTGSTPRTACTECHRPADYIIYRPDWSHGIRSVGAHVGCTNCHVAQAHGAGSPPVLPTGDYNVDGCFSCHQDIGARFGLPYVHSLSAYVSCKGCHPPHEALKAALPIDLVPAEASDLWLNSYDWLSTNMGCLKCHPAARLTSDLTEGFVTLNTVNYHYRHVSTGSVLCIECHDPHGSMRRGMLRSSLITGELLSFRENADGGSCSVRCHDVDHNDWRYINTIY